MRLLSGYQGYRARKIVRHSGCPYCHSPRGELCRTKEGGDRQYPHLKREIIWDHSRLGLAKDGD